MKCVHPFAYYATNGAQTVEWLTTTIQRSPPIDRNWAHLHGQMVLYILPCVNGVMSLRAVAEIHSPGQRRWIGAAYNAESGGSVPGLVPPPRIFAFEQQLICNLPLRLGWMGDLYLRLVFLPSFLHTNVSGTAFSWFLFSF